MFKRKEQSHLERELDRIVLALRTQEPGSAEYTKLVNQLVQLNDLQYDKKKSTSVSKETLAVIGGNLLGILLIIKHEHVNVISSKAMSLLLKPKI